MAYTALHCCAACLLSKHLAVTLDIDNLCVLLQVMDSLYQARVKKNETDLLIDQLKETLHYLTVQNKVGHTFNKAKACCECIDLCLGVSATFA